MKIQKVAFVPGEASFFFDDQKAIAQSPPRNGFLYQGTAETSGFEQIRIPAQSLSILLLLENGAVAQGDCCAVQYSGAAGRDSVFKASEQAEWLQKHVAPLLVGYRVSSFQNSVRGFGKTTLDGQHLHTAVQYGLSQALLDAVSQKQQKTMTEVVLDEYGLDWLLNPVKVFSQSGDQREDNIDKMLLKQVGVLPHGLINDPVQKVGKNGERLKHFVRWVRNRILELRASTTYCPDLHFDTYGTLGVVFEHDLNKIVSFLSDLEKEAAPFTLRIEHPIDGGSLERQIVLMQQLRQKIRERNLYVEIVADEWCNTLEEIKTFVQAEAADMIQVKMPDLGGIHHTIEAVLFCKSAGVKAYLGGSCSETEISAKVSAQLALALQPYQVLAKPGMGVDEGLMLIRNEMKRTYQRIQSF